MTLQAAAACFESALPFTDEAPTHSSCLSGLKRVITTAVLPQQHQSPAQEGHQYEVQRQQRRQYLGAPSLVLGDKNGSRNSSCGGSGSESGHSSSKFSEVCATVESVRLPPIIVKVSTGPQGQQCIRHLHVPPAAGSSLEPCQPPHENQLVGLGVGAVPMTHDQVGTQQKEKLQLQRREVVPPRPAGALAAYAGTRLHGEGASMTQDAFVESLAHMHLGKPRPITAGIRHVFSFKRPTKGQRGQNKESSQLQLLSDTQMDIMYAMAGCADVLYKIKQVSLQTRKFIEDECGISKGSQSLWFKNRSPHCGGSACLHPSA